MNPQQYAHLRSEWKDIRIETERLCIHNYVDSDEDGFFAIFRDAHTMAMDNDTVLPEKNEEFRRRMEMIKGGELLFLCLCDKVRGEFVGFVLLNQYPEEAENAITLGCSLVPNRQSKGYGYEALRGILSALKGSNAVKTILANARLDNAPSLGLLRKLGFNSLGVDGQKAYFSLQIQ